MCFNLIIIITIAIIAIIFLILAFSKMQKGFGPFNIKVYVITLIVVFSSILVLSELETAVLTPIFSIFGGISGYLFGLKNDKNDVEKKKKNKTIEQDK